MPTVSVGLPVFNGENFLKQTILSILDQEFADLELIISDNASTDNTAEICQYFASLDSRVTYLRLLENRGAAYNYNAVFRASTGRYFKWAAHDDVLRPRFLSKCISAHEKAPGELSIVYPKTEYIDATGSVIGPHEGRQRAESNYAIVRAFQVLQSMGMAAPVFGVFDAEKLRRTNLIGSFASSDYALILQASFFGKIVQLEGEPQFLRRIHPSMSRMANLSPEDVLKWFDPKARSRMNERQRLYLEYFKSAYLVEDLNLLDRNLLALAACCGFTTKSLRVKIGRWRRQLFGAGEMHRGRGHQARSGRDANCA